MGELSLACQAGPVVSGTVAGRGCRQAGVARGVGTRRRWVRACGCCGRTERQAGACALSRTPGGPPPAPVLAPLHARVGKNVLAAGQAGGQAGGASGRWPGRQQGALRPALAHARAPTPPHRGTACPPCPAPPARRSLVAPGGARDVGRGARHELCDEGGAHAQAARARQGLRARRAAGRRGGGAARVGDLGRRRRAHERADAARGERPAVAASPATPAPPPATPACRQATRPSLMAGLSAPSSSSTVACRNDARPSAAAHAGGRAAPRE